MGKTQDRQRKAMKPSFNKMAEDVVIAWDRNGTHTNVKLLKLIATQLHAAYVLGRTDADYEHGRVLDTLDEAKKP